MGQRNRGCCGLLCALVLTGVAGCSSVNSVLEADRIDYKTATEKKASSKLDVPPDLTQIRRDNRYAMPTGSVTATDYQQKQAQATNPSETPTVAPGAIGGDVRIERSGNQRWLVVKKSPEVLWPQIKTFWQDAGFLINIEQPDAGIMETEWAENRAKIPQDIIRRTIGKMADSLYSTGELDKFRTRVERGADGSTEIFITHRGAQEVFTGQDKITTVWTPRPSDPELEAELLARLMVRLGVEAERVKVAMAAKPAGLQQRAKLQKGDDKVQGYVEVDEGFDRAWRRVGLALDRVGFTVEDRDRSKGIYFVRYVEQDKVKKPEKGWFSGWFSSSDDKSKTAQKYRVLVKGEGSSSQISVQDDNGKPERSATGTKILTLLHDQLK